MAKDVIVVSRGVAAEFHTFLAKNYQKEHGGTIADALSKTVGEVNAICSTESVPENPHSIILEKARFYQKKHGGTITAALILVHAEGVI